MKHQNPIGNLYDDILLIIKSLVIKYRSKAIVQDTFEVRRRAERYMDALEKRDTFMTYRIYTVEDYEAVGIQGYDAVRQAVDDPRSVPSDKQEQLLLLRRQREIDSYVEPNNYYRMLNGYPDIEDTDYFYVNKEICKKYGIPDDIPIHEIEDKLNKDDTEYSNRGTYLITVLEGLHIMDKLAEAYPEKKYLKFIGSRRIPIITARRAKNFAILYMTKSAQEPVLNKFIVLYEQAREYFTSVVYSPDMSKQVDYYDNFIALCIAVMTIQQLTVRSLENEIDRDFFDLNSVKALYDSYNFPFMSRLDSERQKAIVQNLNILIQNKSTNKVLYDIASLLGFSDVNIYKYFLTKSKSFDVYGNPIVAIKQEFDMETGEMRNVYDYEKMYKVYFQKVELKNLDFMEAFKDQSLQEDYDERTIPDPFWWEDNGTHHEVWEEEYNFAETKYLGLSISYKMTAVMFETCILLRMIIDKRDEIGDFLMELPRIAPDIRVNIFEAVICLICLICRKFDLSGEIISDYVNSIAVMDTLDIIENEANGTYIDCLNFNFSFVQDPVKRENMLAELSKYFDNEEIEIFKNCLSILEVGHIADTYDKADAFNTMYSNIKNLNEFFEWQISETEDIEEYQVLLRYYRAIFYTNEMRDTFRMGMTKDAPIAETYFQYLEYLNPTLYSFVETCPKDFIGVYTDHIISKMENYIADLKYIYLMSDIDSPAEEALVKMINFFKSFTTDFTGLDIIYTLDFKNIHMLRLIDKIQHIYKLIGIDEFNTVRIKDLITRVFTVATIPERINFIDQLRYYTTAWINDKSITEFTENLEKLQKTVEIAERDIRILGRDDILPTTTINYNDGLMLSDKVIKFEPYSEDVTGLGLIINSDGDYIGKYVKVFESGTRGSTTVSQAGNDGGGSFGTYQMIWSYKGYPGLAQTFWHRFYESKYGAVSTVNDLKTLWVKAATDDPEGFFANEHLYIGEQCYEPLIKQLGDHYNPNRHSRAAQECFWSWAVHRGYYTAYQEFMSIGIAEDDMYSMSIEDLMHKCFDKRRQVMLDTGSSYNAIIANGRYGYDKNASCERYVLIHSGLEDPFRKLLI